MYTENIIQGRNIDQIIRDLSFKNDYYLQNGFCKDTYNYHSTIIVKKL